MLYDGNFNFSSNIKQLFGDFGIPSCNGFFTSDFSEIPVTSWSNSFAICITVQDLSMNVVLQKTQPQQQLLSARCFKNNSVHVDACECRMDCLLEFSNTIPTGYLIYLKDIGCNESNLSASLSVYNNASNVIPSIELKPGYVDCQAQGIEITDKSMQIVIHMQPFTYVGRLFCIHNCFHCP